MRPFPKPGGTCSRLGKIGWAFGIALTAGCVSDSGVSGISLDATQSGSSSAATSSFSSSCTSQVVDYGVKGSAVGTQRGLHSDTKTIPGTIFPSTAFTDAGGVAGGSKVLKFSYWNGADFVTEVIAGQEAAKAVRLAYLSDGTPIVVWSEAPAATTFFGFLRVAVRSQALTSTSLSTASWTAGLIQSTNGAATASGDYQGLEIAVSPADQVAISYVHVLGTAASNRAPRFAYCAATCANVDNYVAMSTGYVANETAATTYPITRTSVAWCKRTASGYSPMIAYARNVTTAAVARCNITTGLSDCATAGNWTAVALNTFTASSAGIYPALYLDATSSSDTPKLVAAVQTAGATGIRATSYSIGCDAVTFTGGTWTDTIVHATPGWASNGFIDLMRDATNKWHIAVTNATTAAVHYFNNSSATITTGWSTSSTFEAATLGGGFGGADLAASGSTNLLYASYGTGANAAVTTPYDLRLGVAANTSTVSASALLQVYSVDQSGGILPFASGTQIRPHALDFTAAGRPALAWVDASSAATIAGGRLKYALRDSTTAGSAWNVSWLPNVRQPVGPSLMIHPTSNLPYVGYYDQTALRYYLARNSQSDGSGTWETYEFPDRGLTVSPTLPAANENCVVPYATGGTTYPVMVVLESGTGGLKLRSSRLDPATGAWTALSTTPITLTAAGAAHLSCAVDTARTTIAVAYQDLDAAGRRLKYSRSADGGVTWATPVNAAPAGLGDQGIGATLAINPSTGKPAVAWHDVVGDQVLYSACTGTLTTCASDATLWPVTPRGVSAITGMSALVTTQISNLSQMMRAALVFTSGGTPYVAYNHGPATAVAFGPSRLNLAYLDATSSAFSAATFVAGANAALPWPSITQSANSMFNFAMPWLPVAAVSAGGVLGTAFIGPGNYLMIRTCGD